MSESLAMSGSSLERHRLLSSWWTGRNSRLGVPTIGVDLVLELTSLGDGGNSEMTFLWLVGCWLWSSSLLGRVPFSFFSGF